MAPLCRVSLLWADENPGPNVLLIQVNSASPSVTPRLKTRLGHVRRPGSLRTKPFSPPSGRSCVSTLNDRPVTDLNTPISTPSTSSRNRLASCGSPPRCWVLGILADRLPGLRVHGRHRPHHPDPVGVLEVEQAVEIPVQVVREIGDLLPDRLGRIAQHDSASGGDLLDG